LDAGSGSSPGILFYDFTFSPPNSVSILALIADEPRIFEAHNRAVRIAIREFEAFAATRVRRRGANSDRSQAML